MNNKYYFLINSLEGWWAERVTVNFANNFLKEWKEVFIITLKSSNFYNLPKWVKHIALSNVKNNLLMFLLIPWYVIKFRRMSKKYNLKEGMSLLEISNFIHILSKKHSIISFRTHINAFTWVLWYIQKTIIKYLYPKAKKIIVNSLENKYDLTEYLHINEEKIEVIYNPINKEIIHKLKKEPVEENILEKIKGKKVFITTWRLIWKKHHKKILSTLKNLPNKNRIYLIIWDWAKRKELEEQTKIENIEENVLFLWQQKNVFKYLSLADIFIYASEVEWYPNVLIEAKEMWLPIITSDFKSWAKEVILGEYIRKWLEYPHKWKYGWLLDLDKYKEQFIKVYWKI